MLITLEGGVRDGEQLEISQQMWDHGVICVPLIETRPAIYIGPCDLEPEPMAVRTSSYYRERLVRNGETVGWRWRASG